MSGSNGLDIHMQRLLWFLIGGMKGGLNRARIIKMLHDRPYNANQLTKKLGLDYTTVRHHLKVLEDNNIISLSGGKSYGTMYFLSISTEKNYDIFKEIWDQISKK